MEKANVNNSQDFPPVQNPPEGGSSTQTPPLPATQPVISQAPPPPPPVKKNRHVPIVIVSLILLVLIIVLSMMRLYAPVEKMPVMPVSNESQSTSDEKVIRIGTDATYPPMEYNDSAGNLVGFDVDFGKMLVGEMNAKAEFVVHPWDNLFVALENGEIDMIISSVTITPERALSYTFSVPYINAGQVILTTSDNSTITSPQQLQGKKVGVQKDTTSQVEALKYTDANLVIAYDDYQVAAKALVSRSIDAIIIDLTAGKGIVDANPSVKIASDPFTNEYYGIVFKKGNTALKKQADAIVLSFQERGVLDNIKQKWFE